MRTADRRRYQKLAAWLLGKREKLNISHRDVIRNEGQARRPARAGRLMQPWVSEVEHGDRLPDVFDLMRLATGIGLTGNELKTKIDALLDDRTLDQPKAARVPRPRRTWPPSPVLPIVVPKTARVPRPSPTWPPRPIR